MKLVAFGSIRPYLWSFVLLFNVSKAIYMHVCAIVGLPDLVVFSPTFTGIYVYM